MSYVIDVLLVLLILSVLAFTRMWLEYRTIKAANEWNRNQNVSLEEESQKLMADWRALAIENLDLEDETQNLMYQNDTNHAVMEMMRAANRSLLGKNDDLQRSLELLLAHDLENNQSYEYVASEVSLTGGVTSVFHNSNNSELARR